MIEALIPFFQLSDSPKIANVCSFMGKLQIDNITAYWLKAIKLYNEFFQYAEKSD